MMHEPPGQDATPTWAGWSGSATNPLEPRGGRSRVRSKDLTRKVWEKCVRVVLPEGRHSPDFVRTLSRCPHRRIQGLPIVTRRDSPCYFRCPSILILKLYRVNYPRSFQLIF